MGPEYAPKPGCNCEVCAWARARIERQRRQDEDLADNYARYLAGELVSDRDRD